jgi:hypothetical protein
MRKFPKFGLEKEDTGILFRLQKPHSPGQLEWEALYFGQ